MANSRFSVALHVMTSLAYHQGEAMTSSALAKSVGTNPVVVRRLLAALGKAGLVETHAGKAGGAQLARRAQNVTLADIFKAAECGSAFRIPDAPENKACAVSCQMKKLLSSVLAETERAIHSSLDRVRLADLVEEIRAPAPRGR
jgi:Rrf2 family protein